MAAFADAFLVGDVDRLVELLAPDARFHSPVADYLEPRQIEGVMRTIPSVVRDARATAELGMPEDSAVFFTATVEGRDVDGVLRVVTGADGLAREVTLLVRPLDALIVAVKRMAELLR